MSDCFELTAGDSPLLVSIPHDGRNLPDDVKRRMTDIGLSIPDTDWHVTKLYEFAKQLGATCIVAQYSRYVVDLNRAPADAALYEGQISTGLCPAKTFAGDEIYKAGQGCDDTERAVRVERYWQPYHRKLQSEIERLRERFGFALLLDAHSIATEVPTLFNGVLPDINLGTYEGASCDPRIEQAVAGVADASSFSSILNGRFKGGYITRHYGAPPDSVHAIQIELAQHNYMDENTGQFELEAATKLAAVLQNMLSTFVARANEYFG